MSLILEHQIFAEFFDQTAEKGELPDKKAIEDEMRRLACVWGRTDCAPCQFCIWLAEMDL